jgi:redox-regulated HSP33 family molecular chaperone
MASGLIATSEYIPKKEGLLVRVDMSDYLIDYYLHRKEVAPDTDPAHDAKLKDLIACFAIHLSARTGRETHAWTVHIVADSPYSLFVTGNTGEIDETGVARGFIVGHILTDHIRHTDVSSIHAQFTGRGQTFTSIVRCDTSDIRLMVEQFYEQSEQHPIRIVLSDTSDTAIGLVALPEYDDEWIRSIDVGKLVENTEVERSPLRSVEFSFACDCSPQKLIPFFQTLSKEALADLYGADEELQITCPRCGKQFEIHRRDLMPEQ